MIDALISTLVITAVAMLLIWFLAKKIQYEINKRLDAWENSK